MKTIFFAALVLAGSGWAQTATNDAKATLERGLFEEEANHNLPAAIQAYQSVVTQFDQDRKLAATAVFRLGECYRRQGKTNEASLQYQRVLREFSDQAPLIELSRQNLASLGVTPEAGPGAPSNSAARREQKRLLEEEIKLVQQKLDTQKKQSQNGLLSPDELFTTEFQLLQLKRQAAELDAGAPGVLSATEAGSVAPTSTEAEEVRRIQAMIKDSPDLINAKGQAGETPLHIAAAAGQLIVADFLLRNGADINARDHKEATPLYEAAESGRKAMVELLIQHQADLELSDQNGWTPLYRAANKGFLSVVQVLLARGADPNAKAKNGATPLCAGIAGDQGSIVATLLAQKADVNIVMDDGTTPLHIAARYGRQSVAKALVDHGAVVDAKDKLGRTPLAVALLEHRNPLVKFLLANKADPNVEFVRDGNFPRTQTSPLDQAVSGGDPEATELLLKAGAKPNVQIQGRFLPLLNAVTSQNKDVAAVLLKYGADPNLPDDQGRSALHYAVKQTPVMELLLSAKAAVNAKDKGGATPLHWAVGSQLLPAAELLLKHHADPNIQDREGIAPLHLAVLRRNKELVHLLLAHGADPNIRNTDGSTPLDWTRNPPSYQIDQSASGVELPRPVRPPQGFPAPGPWLPGAPSRASDRVEDDRAGIAAALKSHGGVDELPDFSAIRATRQGWNEPYRAFESNTNGLNRFTLLEAIQYISDHGWPGPAPLTGRSQGGSFAFPDFSRIVIHRPNQGHPSEQTELKVNLLDASGGFDCAKDVPLEFGDVIGIPEREHSLAETPVGLSNAQARSLYTCLTRKVKFIVKGQATEITLRGSTRDSYLSQAMKLSDVQSILLSSSDLSAVQVKRLNPATGQELTEDVKSFWDHNLDLRNDIWLQKGDVIEVPDKP